MTMHHTYKLLLFTCINLSLIFSGISQITLPYTESFESGFGSWNNVGGDDFDWSTNTGSTPSNNTGPDGAHSGSTYIYTEVSNPNYPARRAYLEATFDFTGVTNPVFEFYYHMFGGNVGSLHIDVNDGSWNNDVWTISGQQHTATTDAYTRQQVDLSGFANQNNITIRLRVISGNSWNGDVAIDQIYCFDNCGIAAGNSSVSRGALCGAGTVDLSLSGHDPAASIQWQQSLNGGAYSNIAGATSANYTTGTLTPTNTYNFRASVTNGCTSYSDTSLVYVSAGGGTNSIPNTESFESGFGIWTNSTADNNDWIRQTGGTPSNNTGPSGASDGSTYLFVEASNPNFNSTGILEADFDFTYNTSPTISFDYHMYGADMGGLFLDINGTTVWSITGQQQTASGDPWGTQSVDLSAYAGECYVLIQFRNETGASYRSDIGLDNISLTDPCAVAGGSASTSSGGLCAAGTVNLSLSGHDPAGSIQWQQSTGGAFTDIAGGTTANITSPTLSPVNTYQFRARVTNGCTSYSDTVQVYVSNSGGTNTLPNTQDFESGFGIWNNSTSDNNDWTRQSGGTPSGNTGPTGAAGGSFYTFVEASNPNFNSTGILEADFDFTGSVNPQISFDYHMYGADMGTLSLLVNGNVIWSASGQQHASSAAAWSSQTIDLSAYADLCYVLIQFQMETGANYRSDACIDNIDLEDPCAVVGGNVSSSEVSLCAAGTVDLSVVGHDPAATLQWQQAIGGGTYSDIAGATSANHTTATLNPTNDYHFRVKVTNGCISYSDTVTVYVNSGGGGISSFPYTESFESGLGSWVNSTADQIDWTRRSGGTPSNNTGPSAASDGSFYMYTEGSNPNFNSTAIFENNFDFTGISNPSLQFDYHMYGSDMGTLSVVVNGNVVWSASGQQHASSAAAWSSQTIDLSAYGDACYVLVQFIGQTGANFRSDMAIDNINVDASDLVWTGATSTDWNTATNWSPNGIPASLTNVTIPDVSGASGNFPVLNSGANGMAFDVTIDANANIDITSGYILTINGDLTNNGSPSVGAGALLFQGTSLQNINGNVYYTDLTIDNSGAGVVSNGNDSIIGTLTLTNGNFETSGTFVLMSNASNTARIAEITGGSISGDITALRYIDAGSTNWRFMTSPVSGRTLQDWNDDLITTGFPGSDWPDWPSATNRWPNIYYYDETAGTSYEDGYTPAYDITQPINVGQGFWFWSGDTITGTQSFTVDLTGPANTGDVVFPISYNNVGGPTHDGWNLIGNPYPCPIDWDSPNWTRSNINGAVYIWNPDLQQYATYVPGPTPGTGIGTNGGSRYIGSHQAFMVEATSGGALTAHESVKANVSDVFIKQGTPITSDVFGLKLDAPNGFQDEVLIRVEQGGTHNFNGELDAHKVFSSNVNVPSMSVHYQGEDYSVKSFNAFNSDLSIPVKVDVPFDGNYVFSFTNSSVFSDVSCVILEDVINDTLIDLRTVPGYAVNLLASTNTTQFYIHFGTSVRVEAEAATCADSTGNATIYIDGTSDNFNFGAWWEDAQGNVIGNNSTIEEYYVLTDLIPGTYYINISDSNGVCGVTQTSFEIEDPNYVITDFQIGNDTIILGETEGVDIVNTTIGATHYSWDFGNGISSSEFEPTYLYVQPGIYNLMLVATNEDGCEDSGARQVVVMDATITEVEEHQKEQVDLYNEGDGYRINFQLDEVQDVNLKVYDIQGKLCHTQTFNQVRNQSYSIDLNASKGVYLFFISSQKLDKAIKMVK